VLLLADLINMETGTHFERSNGVVVVAAKHVGTLGKAPLIRTILGPNGSTVNASIICQADAVPAMQEYYKGNLRNTYKACS
jgi:hypothetical protein